LLIGRIADRQSAEAATISAGADCQSAIRQVANLRYECAGVKERNDMDRLGLVPLEFPWRFELRLKGAGSSCEFATDAVPVPAAVRWMAEEAKGVQQHTPQP